MQLGDKIRERRREVGMTQAELAGDTVTRNMLSQIEGGKASPSLSTLAMLAERLSVPIGYFFCEKGEEILDRKAGVMARLSRLFRAGSYAECLRVFEKELGECDDELGYMMASCAYFCGLRAWKNGSFETAVAYLSSAEDYVQETAYPADWILAGCRLLIPIGANVQAPLLEFNEHAYIDSLRRAGCLDVFCYLTEREGYAFENPYYEMHLRGRKLLRESHFSEALALFSEIEKHKGEDEITAYLLIRTYADMEIAYRELGDYEGAYRYSTKRHSLLAAFKS